MKIAVVVGSTRPGRVGLSVAEWVHEHAAKRSDADFELLDLKPFGLVLLDEETVPGAANRQYERAETRAWSEAVEKGRWGDEVRPFTHNRRHVLRKVIEPA